MITINLWYVLKESAKWLLILLLLLRHVATGMIVMSLALVFPVCWILHVADAIQTSGLIVYLVSKLWKQILK
jgi:hypothetical protein